MSNFVKMSITASVANEFASYLYDLHISKYEPCIYMEQFPVIIVGCSTDRIRRNNFVVAIKEEDIEQIWFDNSYRKAFIMKKLSALIEALTKVTLDSVTELMEKRKEMFNEQV